MQAVATAAAIDDSSNDSSANSSDSIARSIKDNYLKDSWSNVTNTNHLSDASSTPKCNSVPVPLAPASFSLPCEPARSACSEKHSPVYLQELEQRVPLGRRYY